MTPKELTELTEELGGYDLEIEAAEKARVAKIMQELVEETERLGLYDLEHNPLIKPNL